MPYGLFHWLNYMWMLVIAPFGSYIWGDFWLLRSRQKEEQHVFLFLNFLVEIKFFYALTTFVGRKRVFFARGVECVCHAWGIGNFYNDSFSWVNSKGNK